MTTPTELPREAQLVAYFVTKCAGKEPLGRTQLMKLLYLADYEARRYLGRPISGLDYMWHHFGPYDDRLLTAVDTLEKCGVIQQDQITYPTGQKGFQYRPAGKSAVTHTLEPIELEILRFVCTSYRDVKLRALLSDVVYETEPMQDAKKKNARGEKLDMTTANGLKGKIYDITFEELYARLQAVRGGDFIPHAEVMRSLRGHAVA